MLAYEDARAAADWLCAAFGFSEDANARRTGPDGAVDARRARATTAARDHARDAERAVPVAEAPPEGCRAANRWLDNPWVIDGVFVEVDDLDAHYDRARSAGATILREPEEPGVGFRIYAAEDPEGPPLDVRAAQA